MKIGAIVSGLFLLITYCASEEKAIESLDLSFNEFPQEWKLFQMTTGSVADTETTTGNNIP